MDSRSAVSEYLRAAGAIVESLEIANIVSLAKNILRVQESGGSIYVIGNGGSASTASHFVGDLTKVATEATGITFKATAFTDNLCAFTAWSNDTSYDDVFTHMCSAFMGPSDFLVAISGSGRSPNILRAVERAKEIGARTFGLTGGQGGELVGLAHECVVVPSDDMQHIEDTHLLVCHTVTKLLIASSSRP